MAFFALRMPIDDFPETRSALQAWREKYPDLEWMHPSDLHMTLRFIQLRGKDDLARLQELASREAWTTEAFPLKTGSLQVFDRHRHGGVFWLGLATLPPELIQLQEQCERIARAAAFPAETRPFTPHITLARYKAASFPLIQELCTEGLPPVQWLNRSLELMHRGPSGHGGVYKDVWSQALPPTGGERLS